MRKLKQYIFTTLILTFGLWACGDSKEGVKRGQVVLSQNGKEVKQVTATTQNGEKVTLYNDGTWQFDGRTSTDQPTEKPPVKKPPVKEPELSPEDKVKQAVVFQLTGKSYKGPFDSKIGSPENLHRYNIYEFKIKNPTSFSIKALKGEIKITDVFDEEMSTFEFSVVENILPNQGIDWAVKVEVQGIDNNGQILQSKKLKDLKAQVTVKKVLLN